MNYLSIFTTWSWNWSEIAFVCTLGVLILVLFLNLISYNSRKKEREKLISKVYIENGTRFTKNSDVVDSKNNPIVSFNKGDIVLEVGELNICKKKSKLLPGKYTILSANENVKVFNIRLGGKVSEYKHLSSIVLSEGDEITAVSHTIILR